MKHPFLYHLFRKSLDLIPLWMVRRWPLNLWLSVREDRERSLAEMDIANTYIRDNRTGVMFQGSDRVQ